MADQPVVVRIRAIIAQTLRHRWTVSSVPPGVSLFDLCIDPIDRVRIAAAVEDEWMIELPETEIDAWQTPEDIARSVGERT